MITRTSMVDITWYSIEKLPNDDTLVIAGYKDVRMIWKASILHNALNKKTPNHLQFPATHYMLLSNLPAIPELEMDIRKLYHD